MDTHKHNGKEVPRSAILEHLFEYRSIKKKKVALSLVITFGVMLVEFIGGYLTNSIALISDAVHMFTHSVALMIGLIAIFIAKNPPCQHKTFGLYRAEILGAFINGIFLLLLSVFIAHESVERFMNPEDVLSGQMFIIALIGLSVNMASIFILRGAHKRDLNVKGIFYHMIADAASSVGIVLAAILIFFTGWNFLDPLVSLGICVLIAIWSFSVIKESAKVLLEMTPTGLKIEDIIEDIKANFPEIENVFHVHIWTITSDIIALSCYIKLKAAANAGIKEQDAITSRMRTHLYEKYSIIESTVQITDEDERNTCAIR